VSIVIRGREVDIIPSSISYGVFWNDTFTFSVYLNDTAENNPILGATPQYFGIGFSGNMLPNGTDGWYSATLHVVNQSVGTYTITIRAQIAAYEDATAQIILLVLEQPTSATLISAQTSDPLGSLIQPLNPSDIWAPRGDLLIFTFNYTGYWNQTIANATGIISYQIGFQDIEYIGNGLYQVTIDTNTLVIGSFSAAVGFSKQNFDVAIISFTIEIRNIPTEVHLLHPVLNVSYLEVFTGDIIRIRVNFTDSWHNLPITDATVFIEIPRLGIPLTQMTHLGNGEYEVIGILAPIDGIFDIMITATAENHEPGEFVFQLRVQTHPVTRQIVTYGLIGAVIGIIILIAWLAYTRVFAIPWLVRKMRGMAATLGKGRTPKLSGRDQRRISSRPDQMTDMMEDAYDIANISFVASAIPVTLSIDEREAEEVDIWHELDQLEGLGRDQKLELFEEMKRIPVKDRIWFLEDLKRQMADGTRFGRTQMTPPDGLLDKTAEEQVIQVRLDAIPALSEREKKTLFKQISSLPPEEREEVFETLKEQYELSEEDEE
jgi:hypothetical protein